MSNPVIDLRVGSQTVKRLVKNGAVLWDRAQEVKIEAITAVGSRTWTVPVNVTEAEVMEDYRRFLKRQRTFSMKTDTLVPYRLIES